jgi:hypothetical protein
MPAHDGVGLDEHQGAAPVTPRLGEHDPEEPISRPKLRTIARTRQWRQLLTKCQILKGDGAVSAADQTHCSEEHDERRQHARSCRELIDWINPTTTDRSYCGEPQDRLPLW